MSPLKRTRIVAMTDAAQPPTSGSGPRSVRYYYIKNALFRVVHVDGAIGGITPTGKVHCAFYSERPAIPQETEFKISDDGRLGDQLSIEGKHGIIRELDFDIQMDLNTTVQLRDWLSKMIDDLKAVLGADKPT
jgi:hypothetical protein